MANSKPHRLQRLLAPESVALVGVTTKPNAFGNDMVLELQVSRYPGRVFPVNPKYDEILGQKCYADLEDIPTPVDIVDLFQRVERVPPFVDQAIKIGAR